MFTLNMSPHVVICFLWNSTDFASETPAFRLLYHRINNPVQGFQIFGDVCTICGEMIGYNIFWKQNLVSCGVSTVVAIVLNMFLVFGIAFSPKVLARPLYLLFSGSSPSRHFIFSSVATSMNSFRSSCGMLTSPWYMKSKIETKSLLFTPP